MRPRVMTILSLQFCAALLMGCADRQTKMVETKPITIPLELLQCEDKPNPPGPDGTQKSVAFYVVELNELLDDCKARMAALYEILRGN